VPLTNVIIEIHVVLLFTLHSSKNIAYHITEALISYSYKLMVMGNSKNSFTQIAKIWCSRNIHVLQYLVSLIGFHMHC